MKLKEEQSLNYMALVTEYSTKIEGLWLFYHSTERNIQKFSQQDWFNSNLSRFENKMRMKEFGGSIYSYRTFLRELSIIGLAKIFEDITVSLERWQKINFNIWKHDELKLPFHKEVRCIRALSNVIKHDQSIIQDDGSNSNTFLLKQCNIKAGFEIGLFDLDIPRQIFYSNVFLDYLCAHFCDVEPMSKFTNENEAFEQFKMTLIPEFINI